MHTDGNGAEQRNAKPGDLSPGKEVPPPMGVYSCPFVVNEIIRQFLCALCALSWRNQLRLLGKC